MKKLMMSLLLIGALPLTMLAQDDDMYFVPTKANQAKEAKSYGMPSRTYYSGSARTVDDYNRQAWSTVEPIDSAGNDVIDFSAVRGVYPDSAYVDVAGDDYQLTRQMTRFDDYTPSEAYWDGYRDGRWSSPWYGSGYYASYYPWYDSWYWNDPWYYSGYYGWHSPWRYYGWAGYYGWGGWYGPRWHGGGWYGGRYGGHHYTSRPVRRTTYSSGRSFGQSPNSGRSSSYSSGSRSFGSPSRSSSGSSFGGSRSGGSFSGGGGGGRSTSGGRSFGGKR